MADIVLGCTDADVLPKPPWQERKDRYIRHLEDASSDIILVSCADKVCNARPIVTNLKTHGDVVFTRFTAGKDGTLWYYSALARVFERRLRSPLSRELAEAVADMERISTPTAPS